MQYTKVIPVQGTIFTLTIPMPSRLNPSGNTTISTFQEKAPVTSPNMNKIFLQFHL